MNKVITKENVREWTVDEYMKEYGENLIGEKIPTPEEATKQLNFFLTFAIGCRRLGLDDLGEIFDNRAALYILALEHMGYKRVNKGGSLNQIIYNASNINLGFME